MHNLFACNRRPLLLCWKGTPHVASFSLVNIQPVVDPLVVGLPAQLTSKYEHNSSLEEA